MEIKRIGIIANEAKPHVRETVVRLAEWAKPRNLDILPEKDLTGAAPRPADLVVAMGGDGTLLRAARLLRRTHIPILGVNMGTFGYLTVVNQNEMFDALETVLAGDFRTERRMMLDVSVPDGRGGRFECSVLNDAVINRGSQSRMVDLETTVDGQYLTTYRTDGLIVSTPTGSTAYSLSAGGPIVFPALDSIILNPICPHSLTNRPVLLPKDARLKIVLWTREAGAVLSCDGQVSYNLNPGDAVFVRRSESVTNLILSPRRDYLQILRSKLGWGGSAHLA